MSDFVIEKGVLIKYKGAEDEVVIPDGVTDIGEEAFSKCANLTICASVNSHAHTYAETAGISFNIE